MPERASSCITSSTSLIISGSSAEVGSSKSMIFGCIASARAIATRCCCPPESCAGYFSACSGMPTRSSSCIASASASAFGMRRTFCGPSVMLLSTDRWGNRLNCWNTIPTSERMAFRLRTSSFISIPSITIRPASCSSSLFRQRMKVDFPEPDGPSTTTISCSFTVIDTLSSAWKSPNHLSTPSATMMSSLF